MPWRRRSDADFQAEIEAHIALETDRLIAEGRSAADARAAAVKAFGSATLARERFHESSRMQWISDAGRDVSYSLRSLRRSPAFACVAILTLALGIGANSTIFSVLHAVLLRPLPFPNADRLVRIIENRPPSEPFDGRPARRPPFAEDIRELREKSKLLSAVGLYSGAPPLRLPGQETEGLAGARLSRETLDMLGARPILGRLLEVNERGSVLVLSHQAWQSWFNSDPGVLGRTLPIDDGSTMQTRRTSQLYTVIGVMAPGFAFPAADTAYWIPGGGTQNVALVKEGVSREAAAAEVSAILYQLTGKAKVAPTGVAPPRFELVGIQEELVKPVRPVLRLMAIVVGVVLLIACANVANLLLARSSVRQREIAVRAAIGASRSRLVRQMLTESLVISLAGGVVGLAFALAGVQLFRNLFIGFGSLPAVRQTGSDFGPAEFPRIAEIGLDPMTLLFTAGVCVVTALLFGMLPALRQTRSGIDGLRDGASISSGLRLFGRNATRSLLVIAQVAFAMSLLVGGGLVVHSLLNLLQAGAGFDPTHVVTFQVHLDQRRKSVQDIRAFSDELMLRLKNSPGVAAAGYANGLPLIRLQQGIGLRLTPAEEIPEAGGPGTTSVYHPDLRLVSPEYLNVIGTRFLAGSGFESRSPQSNSRHTLVINETLARGRFGNQSPVGRQVYLTLPGELGADPWEIAGIVENIRQQGLDVEPAPQMFADFTSWPRFHEAFDVPQYFAIRTTGEETPAVAPLAGLVRQLDPGGYPESLMRMEDMLAYSIARPRVYALLLGMFACLALVIASAGVYGVISYAVAQSTRELGVRLALGARRGEVLRMVLGRAGILTGLGISLGVAGAVGLTRYLGGMLFGLTALNPATFIATALLFALVALLASYIPARRATRIDPIAALRND